LHGTQRRVQQDFTFSPPLPYIQWPLVPGHAFSVQVKTPIDVSREMHLYPTAAHLGVVRFDRLQVSQVRRGLGYPDAVRTTKVARMNDRRESQRQWRIEESQDAGQDSARLKLRISLNGEP